MKNMNQAGPSGTKIPRIIDFELEDDLNSGPLRRDDSEPEAMEQHYVEAQPVPDNEVEDNGELGLEPQVDSISEIGEVGSPTLLEPQSPQGSMDSMSSTNVRTDMPRASDLLMAVSVCAEPHKSKIIELAMGAMEELPKIALGGEPLWQRKEDSESEFINRLEYFKDFGSLDETIKVIMKLVEVGEFRSLDSNIEFSSGGEQNSLLPKQNIGVEPLCIESSREIAFVSMNPINLVELLMDLKQWSSTFSNIVSRASLLGVLTTRGDWSDNWMLQVDLMGSRGAAMNYDRMLHVMSAEFHLPTAFVPSRESHFARYCRKLANGTWAVVDVSLDSIFPYPVVNFRRRPSGCLIQEMPNGCSKVIWVEHMEVDNELVHPIFRPLVMSGFAFSAKRWLSTIIRHCEGQATLMAARPPILQVLPQAGRESLLNLAGRMTQTYYLEICASTGNVWMTLPFCGAEEIRAMTKTSTIIFDRPISTILFTTSLRLPVPPKGLFNFLRCDNSRNMWDMLSLGYVVQELGHVVKGENPENRVSIIQVNATPSQIAIMYLQESYSDDTGSYVVFTPMDILAMSRILNGADPDYVSILPSGFAILPDSDKPSMHVEGSILTIAFHIVDNSSIEGYISPLSIETIHRVIETTSNLIKTAVLCNHCPNDGPVSVSTSIPL